MSEGRLERSWRRAWADLSLAADVALRDRLLARYDEPQRAYHTRRHLEACIAEFDDARDLAERPGEVALALWFHDAVYDPRASGNEAASADWAERALRDAGADAGVARRVGSLVLATRHDAVPVGADECLLVDVDLSILGAPEDRFDAYEAEVRREYAWVPEATFALRRRAILAHLLDRPRLYATDRFHDRLEARARANLARSIARLEASQAFSADGATTAGPASTT